MNTTPICTVCNKRPALGPSHIACSVYCCAIYAYTQSESIEKTDSKDATDQKDPYGPYESYMDDAA